MAQSQIASIFSSGSTFLDNASYYVPISGTRGIDIFTTVAPAESPIRDAGVFSNLYTYSHSNTASVTSTVTLQKSQADTSITISYTSDQTGIKEDTSNTATFAATDEANYEVTIPSEAGNNSLGITVFGISFSPTTSSDCISFMIFGGNVRSITTPSTTFFFPPTGEVNSTPQTTETFQKYRIRQTFTASDFYSYITANARTTDTVFGTRKDGGAGSQSVTYTSGQTGAKEDTSNTDSLVAGSDLNYRCTTSTGTETITMAMCSCSLISTANFFHLLGARPAGDAVALNVTTFTGVSGRKVFNTTENNSKLLPEFTFTISELGSMVSANTNSLLTTDVFVRDNGSNSSVTVSYAAAQTGLKNDSSNTTEITSGTDEINYSVVNNELVSGSITFTWIGCLGSTSSTPVVTAKIYSKLLTMGVG